MRNLIALVLLLGLLLTSGAQAASYFRTNGVVVDPIQSVLGGNLAYAGANLEPLADLSGANLTEAYLIETNLTDAKLIGANLTNALLSSPGYMEKMTHLQGEVMHGANLTGAKLAGVNLRYAKLHGALGLPGGSSSQLVLSDTEEMIMGAHLTGADFSGADLTGADFNHDNDQLDAIGWSTATWTGAWFHYQGEPDWPTGMIHTDHGIGVCTPEPATLLSALVGLALLPRRRGR